MEFSVAWSALAQPERNGVIRSYTITLTEEYSGNAMVFSVLGNVTSFEFLNLHPAYTYALEIAAVTVSHGPNSDVMLVKMADDSECHKLVENLQVHSP